MYTEHPKSALKGTSHSRTVYTDFSTHKQAGYDIRFTVTYKQATFGNEWVALAQREGQDDAKKDGTRCHES